MNVNKSIYFSYPCRRHSCSLVNIPAPCVSKIISHIDDVESKIQQHLKQLETSFDAWSRTSSMKDLKEDWSIAVSDKEVQPGQERDEMCPELRQQMETLLSEAIHLIKCLESDRAEAEEALKHQRIRKKKVSLKIDAWSIWKLQELPLAVQKEHEAYMRDIIELQWHLEDKIREAKLIEKHKVRLEEANARIQADIDYLVNQIPLLDAKQKLEVEALRECYQKKFEVMELCRKIHGDLEEALEDFENTKFKSKQLKEDFEKEILKDEASINNYKKELDKLANLFNHYISSINNVNTDIEEHEEAVTEVIKETKSSRNEVASLSKVLDDLKKTFDQQGWKQKNFEQQYLDALNKFYAAKKSWAVEISNVSKEYSEISLAYMQVMEEKRRLEIDIDNVTNQISDSIRKKAEHESEIQSLLKLKSKNNVYLKQLYMEAYHISAVYHLIKHKTEELDDKISEVRRRFKGREDFLKKLIRSQVAAGMVMQKRMFSIQESQLLERQDLLQKKAIYNLTIAGMEEPLSQMEEEAERIRAIHQDQTNTLNEVLEKKANVRRRVEKTKKSLKKRGRKTLEALTETESKRSTVFKELEKAKSKTIIFHTKIDELSHELEIKEKEKKRFEKILVNLRDVFLTAQFKREHAQAVFDQLMEAKANCEERLYEEEQRFRKLFAMRQNTLGDMKKMQEKLLVENLCLAQEYQHMQKVFLKEKDNYLCRYDKQLSLDASLRDKKQLCMLQKRMQGLWQEHMRLVVLYSQRRLASFQTDSQETIQKILAVQDESSNLMQHILGFFQTLTDGSSENDG
ncbi:coiled-coil domain-containing protein 178 [Ochotona curzoniae]|uniref:coiled-coil domain-containing protein 178 n=1 Tax=Ochotona curzoniae TaxID=130825 RepID=UPI001B353F6D|nr:coiled-coil domain-containing protein 178 [Ochotona curzoniae]